jgi:hypothetical protein
MLYVFLIRRHVFTNEMAERKPSVINSIYNVYNIYSGRISLHESQVGTPSPYEINL